ncbi:MAG: DegT/DnrJ/EryC1/StrS family aminotransferase [Patescibacteria group bacterium]
MNINQFFSKIKEEEVRNSSFLHLTANEPVMSQTARSFMSSKLADRYFMGAGVDGKVDLGPLTALGFPGVAELVEAAENAAKEMLGAQIVNLSCLSGVHAMMCAILSTTEPGDVVMTVHHDHGGHFATQGILDRVGRKHVFAEYDFKTLSFDTEKLAQKYQESGAKAFYMDVSYYVNPHNLREIREALGAEAIIIYDASHTMGLIMGQTFQDPFVEGADVICANTHKTLPGPHKGMIAFKNAKLGEKANDIIDDCLYSTPQLHHMIALATTILEMKEFGQAYAQQVIINSNALGTALSKRGMEVRNANTGRYSENHQVHLLSKKIGDYRDLYDRLHKNNITSNFDNVFDTGMFLRIGTQEVTRRGMKETEMQQIAAFIDRAFKGELFSDEVARFVSKFQKVEYSFD